MALIRCKNCNHEISDTLRKCIHCGTKVEKVTTIREDVVQTKIQTPKINNEILKEAPIKVKGVEVKKRKNEKILKEKSPKQKKQKNNKFKIIVISTLSIIVLGLCIFVICDKLLNNNFLKNDNKTNNEQVRLKNLNAILTPKITHKQEIENNNIFLDIEIENGKSALYTIDIENPNNKDVTLINFDKHFTCNSGTSYTCIESIDFSWQDDEDNNIIKANDTRTIYLKILTTGNEENGVMNIRISPNFTILTNTSNISYNYTSYIDNATLIIKENCTHCENFQPIVEALADKLNIPFSIIDYEIEDGKNEDGITNYPTLLLYSYGKLVLRHEGYVTEEELIKILKDKELIKE